jgi:beta-glucosidase/6-phospho-beta-glucosidase/beta-galactosidase
VRRFEWSVGIENGLIPDMGVDELLWTEHRRLWSKDLDLARGCGVDFIRYGIPWPELQPGPNAFQWYWSDQVVDHLHAIGLEPIWDLIHFGTPAWLTQGFLDSAYPEAAERFTAAFARRYAGLVTRYTPLNEPYVTARLRGGLGIWPPRLTGSEGFARLLQPIVEGLRRQIAAIRAAHPANEIWLNDGADEFHPASGELAAECGRLTLQRYAALDILSGLAREDHETHEWLVAAGYPKADLERAAVDPTPVDVIGLDYYPDTEHEVFVEGGGTQLRRAPASRGIDAIAGDYWQRYGRPMFVAETSADDAEREFWFAALSGSIARARSRGVEVFGLCWWPLFDHIDWNSLLTRLDGHVCEAGLYHLRPGRGDRAPSPFLDEFRRAVTAGEPAGRP